MARIYVGTDEGIRLIGTQEEPRPDGQRITALQVTDNAVWAILDGATIWRQVEGDPPEILAEGQGSRLNWLHWDGTSLWVGAERARLYRFHGSGLHTVDGFDEVPGRSDWYTPWGGPPDVRSISCGPDGIMYVNVHVGGVLVSADGGASFRPTMDIDADVHEVLADASHPQVAYAATARGLAMTRDGASTWRFDVTGMHATYCRAVAVSDGHVFVSVATGSQGRQSAVYRRAHDGGRLERCIDGLPEWFTTNVNTGCLAALGTTVVIGDESGSVYMSNDDGDTWQVAASGLAGVNCLALDA